MAALPARTDIARKYRWNAERLFASPKAWEMELNAVLESIPTVEKQIGRAHV